MEKGYRYDQKIAYEGARHDLSLSFHRLIAILQEAAIAHSDSTRFPTAWFTENKKGFLLTNWHVKVYEPKYPHVYENLTVYTWPVMFKGFLAKRGYEIINEEGKRFAAAETRWVFTDTELRKPVKIPQEVADVYGSCSPALFEADYSIPETESYTPADTRDITAQNCDTDSNFHVNNVRYIEWAVNGIPEIMFDKMNVCEMKTVYKKELRRGERVTLETFIKGDEVISLMKDGDVLHAGVYTKWITT